MLWEVFTFFWLWANPGREIFMTIFRNFPVFLQLYSLTAHLPGSVSSSPSIAMRPGYSVSIK